MHPRILSRSPRPRTPPVSSPHSPQLGPNTRRSTVDHYQSQAVTRRLRGCREQPKPQTVSPIRPLSTRMRDMNRAKKQIETSVGEKMQSSNAQVTEWGFPGTRGLATGGSQSSLPEHGKTHAMSHSSGSSVSHDSGGSLFEREETRHQQRLQFLERMVLTDTNCVC